MIEIFGFALGIVFVVFGLAVLFGAPYVPSHRREVRAALRELYPLDSHDVLVDVGSGDGVVLREAAKHDARAIGYEINPILVYISRYLSRKNKRIAVVLADFWRTYLPEETTIVYVFAASRYMNRLEGKMQAESNRLARPLYLMTYGASLKNTKALKKRRGHHLYTFTPLHNEKA